LSAAVFDAHSQAVIFEGTKVVKLRCILQARKNSNKTFLVFPNFSSA